MLRAKCSNPTIISCEHNFVFVRKIFNEFEYRLSDNHTEQATLNSSHSKFTPGGAPNEAKTSRETVEFKFHL